MTRSVDKVSISVSVKGILESLLSDSLSEVTTEAAGFLRTALTSGTTAGKVDRIWAHLGRDIVSAASETIDVYDFGSLNIGGGAGKDALGQSLALAEVVAILIVNSEESDGILNVGGDGTTAAWNSPFGGSDTAYTPVMPGGAWLIFSPTDPAYVVADTSNHLLKLAASGGDVTYQMILLGRSA